MKAAVLYGTHQPFKVEELDLDGPKAGEVKVKLVSGGVCHSDYHRIDGHLPIRTLPFVMGHEGAGIITEVGPGVTSLALGDHVVFSLTPQCGKCRNCSAGRPHICEGFDRNAGTMRDGTTRFSKDGIPYYHSLATFSEETVVLDDLVVKVRDDAPLEKACLIGCGVMTGVGAVVKKAKVEAGASVVVIGCGGVGLNVIQGAVLASAGKIIAVDKLDFKLEKAGEMGATHFVNADKEDAVKRVMEITDGGSDYAFEVIGFPATIRQAFDCTRRGGTTVMVGVPPEDSELTFPGLPLWLDRTVTGTFYGDAQPRVDFPWLIDLYMDGRLKLDEMITRYRPLDEINEAFEDMNKGITARTILTFE